MENVPCQPVVWRCLLLVYPELDVVVRPRGGRRMHYRHRMPENEIQDALDSFACFPSLVSELTGGRAAVETQVVRAEQPLMSLSCFGEGYWWPAPTDTSAQWRSHAEARRVDSLFVFWPQNDFNNNRSIRSGGWGLGMGGHDASAGATYASVANAAHYAWEIPRKGEVWLHEWLHGVCHHFASKGYEMPDGDADGGDRHGYERSPTKGWTPFYRDLMNANVLEDGVRRGIPSDAWLEPLRNT